MRLVTAREMQAIDRATIDGGLVPSLDLMERAGRAAAMEALALLREHPGRVAVLCGKGNNGGDGLVLARVLGEYGVAVCVYLTHPPEALAPDARTNHAKLAGTSVEIHLLPEDVAPPGAIDDPRQRPGDGAGEVAGAGDEWLRGLRDAALCVDALLGTGVNEPVRGRLAAVIDTLNHCSRNTLAVDMPSGIDGDTGVVQGTAVWADRTVTFGLPKLGLALYPGRERAGILRVADIGFPVSVIDGIAPARFHVGRELARGLLPRLDPAAHKYARGSVVVLAGSREFPGAAVLAAQAALRAGAGMVHLVVPASLRPLMQAKLTEVIVHGAAETADGMLARTAEPWMKRLLDRADAWAIGPGLGTATPTQAWVRDLLRQTNLPAVVDADAIPALPPAHHIAPRLVTPHAGELTRWTELPAGTAGERLATAVRTAHDRQVVLLAKGAPTFVATPDGRVFVNSSGHAGLGTAGSGDVLTGLLAGLLAQRIPAENAAVLGAWVHGRAAEIAVRAGSPRSLVASDLLASIGHAYRELESQNPAEADR